MQRGHYCEFVIAIQTKRPVSILLSTPFRFRIKACQGKRTHQPSDRE
jgi:hypothetical protein